MNSFLEELNKLEDYLKSHEYTYERADNSYVHQIIVRTASGKYLCDAICQPGSYGYERGLLEIAGSYIVEEKDLDVVVGWLTAKDVIDRLSRKECGDEHI